MPQKSNHKESLPVTAPPKVSHPGSGSRQGGQDGRLDKPRDQGEARKSTGVDGEYSGMAASPQQPHADSIPKSHRDYQNRWGNASKYKPFRYVPLAMQHLAIIMLITMFFSVVTIPKLRRVASFNPVKMDDFLYEVANWSPETPQSQPSEQGTH